MAHTPTVTTALFPLAVAALLACGSGSTNADAGSGNLTVGAVYANIVNAECERYITCKLQYEGTTPYASMSACVSAQDAMLPPDDLTSMTLSCSTSESIQTCDQAVAAVTCTTIMESGSVGNPAGCTAATLFCTD